MALSLPKRLQKLSRRQALLLGGAGAAAVGGAALVSGAAGGEKDYLRSVKLADVRHLGEGFFVANGWVLTADDVRRLGGDPEKLARGD
jgi:hypothetical protein